MDEVTSKTATAPTPAKSSTSVDEIVDAWFDEHARNSPIAQSSEAFSHLASILSKLKDRLRNAL